MMRSPQRRPRAQIIAARGAVEHRLYHVMSGSIVSLSKEGTILHEARCGQIVGVAAFLDMSNAGQSEVLVTNEETELLVLNLEHVASATPTLHVWFLGALGVGPDEDDPSNKLTPVETQLQWLRAIGFSEVDCHWKWRELALLAGTR